PNRLNRRYHDVLRLSELILRFLGVDVSRGKAPMASFVVNMADAFEGFVEAALIEAFADAPGRVEGQYTDVLDEEGEITIRPDVVYVRDGRPHAVFDAKYKLASRAGSYPNADHHQMLAYCTSLRLSRGYLIYADTPSGKGADWSRYRITNAGVHILAVGLDVTTAPAELVQQIGDVARDSLVRGLALA